MQIVLQIVFFFLNSGARPTDIGTCGFTVLYSYQGYSCGEVRFSSFPLATVVCSNLSRSVTLLVLNIVSVSDLGATRDLASEDLNVLFEA